ncbi:MPN domain-containing protein-like isoform X1 [Rhynchophorus ferrugineus]|uniref:MPN domain-containing protein-like isoform X1 n=2 Tax=Rhynchophorus ferrugineus TaxID=354439 RepID=UPI003FCE4910
MQSQLAAALLGHNTNATSTPNHLDDDENNSFREEDTEVEQEEFDEEAESEQHIEIPSENGKHQVEVKQVVGKDPSNRTVTLQMLLSAGILKPGAGAMTIEYLGQKFVGDLLEDGKIRSQETDITFASPSAWAIACKRFINPDKKSGCGWASVKYKGKKLDAYKNIWYKKKKEEERQLEKEAAANSLNLEQLLKTSTSVPTSTTSTHTTMFQRFVVKHNTIANRTLTHDANTMIECVPFSNLGKIQPFLISLHTNAALLMDFHCHLTKSEVCGYLAGHWEVNSHNLQITHAYPCKNTKTDRANAPQIETEIAKSIEKEKLTLVGWYHSHPFAAAAPTLRDIDAQLDYQIKMRGTHDNSYTPCVGIIISPYNYENISLESSIMAYWVIPPPETKPNEYGRPMLMSYSVIQDAMLLPYIKEEITRCIQYYEKESDFVNFSDKFVGNTLYIDKLKSTMISKFPRDESETDIWRFIRESLKCSSDEKEPLISVPSVTKPNHVIPPLNASLGLNSGLGMLPTDISSLLFNAGKYSSPSSLLGLPDPMAHSTLAANNMFLQSNLFKMQELLKPFNPNSSSTPSSTKTSKNDHKSHSSTTLKIPTDIKVSKPDFTMDYLHFKDKMNFLPPDLNIPKTTGKDYSTDYLASLMKTTKSDYYMPNISITKTCSNPSIMTSTADYSLNLSRPSPTPTTEEEKPAKVAKMDFPNAMLDLSYPKTTSANTDVTNETAPTNLSVSENTPSETPENEAPLNLTGD